MLVAAPGTQSNRKTGKRNLWQDLELLNTPLYLFERSTPFTCLPSTATMSEAKTVASGDKNTARTTSQAGLLCVQLHCAFGANLTGRL